MKQAVAASAEMESYRFDGNMRLQLTLPEETSDPAQAQIMHFLKNLEIRMDGVYQQEPMQSEMNLHFVLKGDMSFNLTLPLVMTTDKMWVKIPQIPFYPLPDQLTGKYLELDYAKMQEMSDSSQVPVNVQAMDIKKQQELGLKLVEILIKHYEEMDYFTLVDLQEAGLPDNVAAENVLQFELLNDDLDQAVTTLVTSALPEILEELSKPEWSDLIQMDPSELDQIKKDFGKNTEQFQQEWDQMKEQFDLDHFRIKMALDKQDFVIYQATDAQFSVGKNEEKVGVALHMEVHTTDINQTPEFEIGIPDEADTVTMEEAVQSMFMPGLVPDSDM